MLQIRSDNRLSYNNYYCQTNFQMSTDLIEGIRSNIVFNANEQNSRKNIMWMKAILKIQTNQQGQIAFLELIQRSDAEEFSILIDFIHFTLQRNNFGTSKTFLHKIFDIIIKRKDNTQQKFYQTLALLLINKDVNTTYYPQLMIQCYNDFYTSEQSFSQKILTSLFNESYKLQEQKYAYFKVFQIIKNNILNPILLMIQDLIANPSMDLIKYFQFMKNVITFTFRFFNIAEDQSQRCLCVLWKSTLDRFFKPELFQFIYNDDQKIRIVFDFLSEGTKNMGVSYLGEPFVYDLIQFSGVKGVEVSSIVKYWKIFFIKIRYHQFQIDPILSDLQQMCMKILIPPKNCITKQIACTYNAAQLFVEVVKLKKSTKKYKQISNIVSQNPQSCSFLILSLQSMNEVCLKNNRQRVFMQKKQQFFSVFDQCKFIKKPQLILEPLNQVVGLMFLIDHNGWLLFNQEKYQQQKYVSKWLYFPLMQYLLRMLFDKEICNQVYSFMGNIYTRFVAKKNSVYGETSQKINIMSTKLLNSYVMTLRQLEYPQECLDKVVKFLKMMFKQQPNLFTDEFLLQFIQILTYQSNHSQQLQIFLRFLIKKSNFNQHSLHKFSKNVYIAVIQTSKSNYLPVFMEFIIKYKNHISVIQFVQSHRQYIQNYMKKTGEIAYLLNLASLNMVLSKNIQQNWVYFKKLLDNVFINRNQMGLIISIIFRYFKQFKEKNTKDITISKVKNYLQIFTNILKIIGDNENQYTSGKQVIQCLTKASQCLSLVMISVDRVRGITQEQMKFLNDQNKIVAYIDLNYRFQTKSKEDEEQQKKCRVYLQLFLLRVSKIISYNSVNKQMTPWGRQKKFTIQKFLLQANKVDPQETPTEKKLRDLYCKELVCHVQWNDKIKRTFF